MPDSPPPSSSQQWLHPKQVLQLHKLKTKKKALQARITSQNSSTGKPDTQRTLEQVFSSKRKNPFTKESQEKRPKHSEESSDQTLFKLLNLSSSINKVENCQATTFKGILNQPSESSIQIVKAKGETRIPVDWSLKTKMKLLSTVPFAWNSKLKVSEEASGISSFARCLDTLDASPNSKFHQCCLYWQHPYLPWLNLFPRFKTRNVEVNTQVVRDSLLVAWRDAFRSLFQLMRTRQCPYFYLCGNGFSVLFRSAGICGFGEMNAVVAPTTRGFRQLLKKEEIEFRMPLRVEVKEEEEEEVDDDGWLQDLGVQEEDIKKINSAQVRLSQRNETELDGTNQSTMLVEGMEVNALYNFLLNSKSIASSVPPTLLAPVAFHGATLNSLRVRESRVHVDDERYFALELIGPILPTVIHNLCYASSLSDSFTISFCSEKHTEAFSEVKSASRKEEGGCGAVFGLENLRDCGLNGEVLRSFCGAEGKFVCNVECLKYSGDEKSFTWT